MLPNDIGILHPLIEILETLEMSEVLLFVCGLQEGNGNIFPSNPLVEVVFDLHSEPINNEEENNLKDLQLLRPGRWLTTRAFHLQKTLGALCRHPFPPGTRFC